MNIKQLKKMHQITQTILLLTFTNVLLCFTKRNNRFVIVDCTGKTYPLNSYSNNLINTKNIDNSIQKCYFLNEPIDMYDLTYYQSDRVSLEMMADKVITLNEDAPRGYIYANDEFTSGKYNNVFDCYSDALKAKPANVLRLNADGSYTLLQELVE